MDSADPFSLDEKRREILRTGGHILIEGGPGCGKTTIALLKAKNYAQQLEAEQRILFLSFSRAAVRQVTDRMKGTLSRSDRELIQVKTFHAFFLDVVRSHARLLNGRPATFITPERESQRKADYEGIWEDEIKRLANEQSVFVFDTLAPVAAELVRRSVDVRRLYSSRFPLIIVDEFQDTNRDQWRVIEALAEQSTIISLADPDQRIFDHLEGVDEYRLTELRQVLSPATFDLSADNHRSPSAGILEYANSVLRNKPADLPEGVADWRFAYEPVELRTHDGVLQIREGLAGQLGAIPTIAVLTRTNALAARISEALSSEQVAPTGVKLASVDHVLAWDPELTAVAALVISSVLEWPLKDRTVAVVDTLGHIADYYRTKLGKGTQGARTKIVSIERSRLAIEENRNPVIKTAKSLLEQFDKATEFEGMPVSDWQVARALLAGSSELDEIFRQARLLRLLRATDSIAWALLDSWDGHSGYLRAADTVRIALAEEAVQASREDPPPVSIMTMHKSKGKEFDAVVIVEGRHQGQLVGDDPKQHAADRRLLRVAITRARHFVLFVRPGEAMPLTPTDP